MSLFSSSQAQTPSDDFLSSLCCWKAESEHHPDTVCLPMSPQQVVSKSFMSHWQQLNLNTIILSFKIHQTWEKIAKTTYILYFFLWDHIKHTKLCPLYCLCFSLILKWRKMNFAIMLKMKLMIATYRGLEKRFPSGPVAVPSFQHSWYLFLYI